MEYVLSESIYYVYMLCDPRKKNTSFTNSEFLPFYIGKGKGPRANKHLTASVKQTFLRNKIAKIREAGKEPIVQYYKDNLTQEEAFVLEKELILKLGRINYEDNGILVNLSVGGIGGSGGVKLSKETRARMSVAKQNMTAEHKEKISKNHRYNKKCKVRKPDGEEIIVEGLTRYCAEHGLDYQPLRNSIRFKKPVRSGASLGWTLLEFFD